MSTPLMCCAICGAYDHSEPYDCKSLTREARLVVHRGRVKRLEDAAVRAAEQAEAARDQMLTFELEGFGPGHVQALAEHERKTLAQAVADPELPF